jgi:hypothetical protein
MEPAQSYQSLQAQGWVQSAGSKNTIHNEMPWTQWETNVFIDAGVLKPLFLD